MEKNMRSQIKRNSIKSQLRLIVMAIVIIAVLSLSVIGIVSMLRIKETSEEALVSQLRVNLNNIINNKVQIADLELWKFTSYARRSAYNIEYYYDHLDEVSEKEVLPPRPENANKNVLQRYILSKDIKVNDIKKELSMFANLEMIWDSIMKQDGDIITSVYAATEVGAMITYDKSSDLAELDEDGESYFYYKERPWYQMAKDAGKTIFTDLSQDYYGKGLTLTCATPFYDHKKFAGVIAMDILVTDLQSEIIDVDFGEGAYAFLVDDKNGNIVASPFVKIDQIEFENITDPKSNYYEISSEILARKTDIKYTNGGVYCAYAPVNSAKWSLCIHVPESLVLEPVKNIEKNITWLIMMFISCFLMICMVVLVIVNRFVTKITNPIFSLKNQVEKISNGDIDQQVEITTNDEISDLGNAFNKMTVSLKKYIKDLTDVTAEKERIGAELNVATQIQASMLPTDFENYVSDKRFSIFASMTPAKEVGGDFYDFFMIDDKHMAIVVADVSGKGVPAALFMVIGKTLIKDHSMSNRDLGEIFAEVNNLLCEANSEELFITAFEAVINLETGKVRYVNAGHEMPFIYRKGKEWNAFEMKAAFVLAGMEGMKYKAGEFDIEPGDKIFQYTDGVTEATNVNNELYGMDRLKKILDANTDIKPAELLPTVKADIDKFVGEAPQFDDITMLGFEYISNVK